MAQNSTALALVGGHRPASVLPREDDFTRMVRMAELYAKSGILPKGINNYAAAALIIEQGFELGIPPAASLRTISLIEGKPTLDASMQRALIFRDHGDDAFRFIEATAKTCTIEYKRRGWSEASRFTLTIDEIPAGLRRKDNWINWPGNMLRARATTFVAVMAFSDTTLGLYTPEEMGAEVAVGPDGEPFIIEARTVTRDEEEHSVPAVPQQPARSSLPVTRNKPAAQPNGAEEAKQKLIAFAHARGVALTADMTPSGMAYAVDAALVAADKEVEVRRTADGGVTVSALQNALRALPERAVDQETGEVQEAPIEGEAREEDEMSEADRALYAATDQGTLLGTNEAE